MTCELMTGIGLLVVFIGGAKVKPVLSHPAKGFVNHLQGRRRVKLCNMAKANSCSWFFYFYQR